MEVLRSLDLRLMEARDWFFARSEVELLAASIVVLVGVCVVVHIFSPLPWSEPKKVSVQAYHPVRVAPVPRPEPCVALVPVPKPVVAEVVDPVPAREDLVRRSYESERLAYVVRELRAVHKRLINDMKEAGYLYKRHVDDAAEFVEEMNSFGYPGHDPRAVLACYDERHPAPPALPRARRSPVELPAVVHPPVPKSQDEIEMEKLFEREERMIALLERKGDTENARIAREEYRKLRESFLKPSPFHET